MAELLVAWPAGFDYDARMVFLLLPSLLGCPEYNPSKTTPDHVADGPAIEVTPELLDFGLLDPGESASASFTIRSVGSVALGVEDIRVLASDFTLVGAPAPLSLAPGEETSVDVVYTAGGMTAGGWVSIFSDDGLRPEARVQLVGEAISPAIRLEPVPVDFSAVARGDVGTEELRVVNAGTATLTILDVSVTGAGFGASSPWSGTATLAPGEQLPLSLTFSPPGSGSFDGIVWVSSDAPTPRVSAPLVGTSGRPVAVCRAEPRQVAANDEQTQLVGTDSYDPEGGTITAWTWTMVERPPGSGAVLPAFSGPIVSGFGPDLAGIYTFSLVVENEAGLASEPCLTEVQAVPSQDLWVELSWNERGDDLDLHLLAPGGSLLSGTDCYYANCVGVGLDWGRSGVGADNPRLDLDDIPGTGPENVNISAPADGEYTVYVHDYAGSRFTPANTYRVRIYLAGVLAWEGERTLLGEDTYDPVATIRWPDAVVEPF
jgi:hypothetical protein